MAANCAHLVLEGSAPVELEFVRNLRCYKNVASMELSKTLN